MEDEPTAPSVEESVADVPVSVVPCNCTACQCAAAREFASTAFDESRGLVITREANLTPGGESTFRALRGGPR